MKSQETNMELDIISLQKTLEDTNLSKMEKSQIFSEYEIKNLPKE